MKEERGKEIYIKISGPMRLIVGREVIYKTNDSASIFEVLDYLKNVYNKKKRVGNNFDSILNQLIIYVDGKRWNKKDDIRVKGGSKIDIVHVINGG